jgi:hypothetical protein
MSQNENQNNGTIVGTKRVRREKDTKKRDKVVLTFGLDKEGRNSADALISAVSALKGKQINLDIRIEEKTTESGKKYDAAFVLVKEMIPKDQGGGQTTYVPKPATSKKDLKDRAAEVAKALE